MGRKPKSGSKTVKTTETKRRGRRPKKILDNVNLEESSKADDQENNSAVILRLKLDPKKFNIGKKQSTKKESGSKTSYKSKEILPDEKKITRKTDDDVIDVNNNDENESSESMFKNDIPNDDLCQKCSKNEKTIMYLKSKLEKYEKKDNVDKTNKIYTNSIKFISFSTGKKISLKKTSVKCWWDSHPFTSLPCFLPESYHNNTYHVTGCFCSFNCALAYNLYFLKDSKIYVRKALTCDLYREMYGLGPDDVVDIKEAPPKFILEDFGGQMSIDAFRKSFTVLNREYIVYMPPIKPINMYIEERNLGVDSADNDKEYVLKRTKPLNKKKSIMSCLKMKTGDDNE